MNVIDLPNEHEKLYFQCLEEWSDEIREAGNHKEKWYRKMKGQGLRVKVAVDRDGIQELLWKQFSGDAIAPKWIKQRKKPGPEPGKVVVTCFKNGWCPAQNLAYVHVKRAANEFGDI